MSSRFHTITREPADADTAVLLLHGILSAPQYFDFLLEEIPETYAVHGVLFAGHGGAPEGLAQTNLHFWRRQAEEAAVRLMQKYKKIIVIAHSMGTLFALRLAQKYPEKISRMILLGVPLYAQVTPFGACCAVCVACGGVPDLPYARAMQYAYSLNADPKLWHYVKWLPRYTELFAEMHAVKSIIPTVRVPAEIFQSLRDELVTPSSIAPLARNPYFRCRMLRDSSHFYYAAEDCSRILRSVRRCMRAERQRA